MGWKIFKTRDEARAEAEKMLGWFNPRATLRYDPGHEWATKGGNVWVVAVGLTDSPRYLREDGFVR